VGVRKRYSRSRHGTIHAVVETTTVIQQLTKKNLGFRRGRKEHSRLVSSSYHDRVSEFRQYLLYGRIERDLALFDELQSSDLFRGKPTKRTGGNPRTVVINFVWLHNQKTVS
jgi:hypothetical protein